MTLNEMTVFETIVEKMTLCVVLLHNPNQSQLDRSLRQVKKGDDWS